MKFLTATLAVAIILTITAAYPPQVSSSQSVVAGGGSVPYAQPTTPIDHLVFIIQENEAFDHYFGAFPNLLPGYGLNYTVCERYNLSDPQSACVHPWQADSISRKVIATDLSHGTQSRYAYDNGSMDGFVSAQYLYGNRQYANYSMSYYTYHSLPNYWDLASYYTLDANFFSSVLWNSYPNHLYTVSARGGAQATLKGDVFLNLTYPTIVDQMNRKGIDWKYYQDDWELNYDCQKLTTYHLPNFYPYRNILPDFPAVQLNNQTCWRIQNLNNLFSDIANNSLPQVSWVTPNENASEHPGSGGPKGLIIGQEYTASVIDDIESNPKLWNSTAIFLTWDDFGGYYDNVPPTQVDRFGYSFRVPLIVISPYSPKGSIYYGVNYRQEDFSAFLSTIEANWNLQNLTDRDGAAASLLNALNFSQSPLPPLILPLDRLAVYPPGLCLKKGICSIGASVPLDLRPSPYAPGFNPAYVVIPGDDTSD